MRQRKTRQTITKKVRRNSGRNVPHKTIKSSKRFIIDNCIEPQEEWREWFDYRDGMREWGEDNTLRLKLGFLVRNLSYAYIGKILERQKKIRKLLRRKKDARTKKDRYT